MSQSKHVILGVHITNRARQAGEVMATSCPAT